MLRVDLRALHEGPAKTNGDVSPTDPRLAELGFELSEPVRVRGRLMESGAGSYYWDARLGTRLTVECRRCLAPVVVELDQAVQALFTEDDAADDPAVYVIPHAAGQLDLGEAIREELILAAPDFPLCRDDCRGLCPRCGADLNAGPCTCRPEADPRWAALAGLKRPETE